MNQLNQFSGIGVAGFADERKRRFEKPVRNTELGSSVNPQPRWLRYCGSARFQRAG